MDASQTAPPRPPRRGPAETRDSVPVANAVRQRAPPPVLPGRGRRRQSPGQARRGVGRERPGDLPAHQDAAGALELGDGPVELGRARDRPRRPSPSACARPGARTSAEGVAPRQVDDRVGLVRAAQLGEAPRARPRASPRPRGRRRPAARRAAPAAGAAHSRLARRTPASGSRARSRSDPTADRTPSLPAASGRGAAHAGVLVRRSLRSGLGRLRHPQPASASMAAARTSGSGEASLAQEQGSGRRRAAGRLPSCRSASASTGPSSTAPARASSRPSPAASSPAAEQGQGRQPTGRGLLPIADDGRQELAASPAAGWSRSDSRMAAVRSGSVSVAQPAAERRQPRRDLLALHPPQHGQPDRPGRGRPGPGRGPARSPRSAPRRRCWPAAAAAGSPSRPTGPASCRRGSRASAYSRRRAGSARRAAARSGHPRPRARTGRRAARRAMARSGSASGRSSSFSTAGQLPERRSACMAAWARAGSGFVSVLSAASRGAPASAAGPGRSTTSSSTRRVLALGRARPGAPASAGVARAGVEAVPRRAPGRPGRRWPAPPGPGRAGRGRTGPASKQLVDRRRPADAGQDPDRVQPAADAELPVAQRLDAGPPTPFAPAAFDAPPGRRRARSSSPSRAATPPASIPAPAAASARLRRRSVMR